MDNITHSLFGAAVSETVWESIPTPHRPKSRGLLLFVSVLANNFPDLDLIYAAKTNVNRALGYLVHHRGFTHCFLPGLLEMAVLLLGLWGWGRVRKTSRTRVEWIAFFSVVFLGISGHIFLDSLNSYGVHPFWPFSNHWYYGDTLFILEPWLWVSFSLFLAFILAKRTEKLMFSALLFLALGLVWGSGLVPFLLCLLITAWCVLLTVVFYYLKPIGRCVFVWCAFSAVLLSFAVTSTRVRREIEAEVRRDLPGLILNDTIISPLPANPLCWSVVMVDTLSTRQLYRVRGGWVALWPAWLNLKECSERNFQISGESKISTTDFLFWEREWTGSISDLRDLRTQHCSVHEFLKFSRAPIFWKEGPDIEMTDMRFERLGRGNFSRIRVTVNEPPCSTSGAPWEEPREDLLKP